MWVCPEHCRPLWCPSQSASGLGHRVLNSALKWAAVTWEAATLWSLLWLCWQGLWGPHTETGWVFIDFCLVHFQKQVEAGVFVTMEMVKDALDQLRGAVMIVYPMGLPPYDPIRMEFENKEDLSGTQVCLEVVRRAGRWSLPVPEGPPARLQGGTRVPSLFKPVPCALRLTPGSTGSHSGIGSAAVVGCQGAEEDEETLRLCGEE